MVENLENIRKQDGPVDSQPPICNCADLGLKLVYFGLKLGAQAGQLGAQTCRLGALISQLDARVC